MNSAGSPLQELLDQSTDKQGLCIICSCTEPRHGDPIVNCTASERMQSCFQAKLGYSTIEYSGLSTRSMNELLHGLSTLQVPPSCRRDFRFLFYFFGHGTKNQICLSDGNFERSRIITELEKIDHNITKIILFDSCRAKPLVRVAPLQESMARPPPPKTTGPNTLVIHATDFRSKAYYSTSNEHPEMKGCGLVTHFFTTLAPVRNEPLSSVLAEVRKEVDSFVKKKTSSPASLTPQVLVYDHHLADKINLLVDSTGEGT